jgi:hypothetical protein
LKAPAMGLGTRFDVMLKLSLFLVRQY